MSLQVPGKRSASPLPRHFDDIRRVRLADDKKKRAVSTAAPVLDQKSAERGQEVLSLSPLLQQPMKHEIINDLILKTTTRLASEAKRLVRAPRLLSDGIAFDWVYDINAPITDIKSLLSVEGIRHQDLERVLHRATPASDCSSRTGGERQASLARASGSNNPAPSRSASSHSRSLIRTSAGNASDPIVVDDEDEEESVTYSSCDHSTPPTHAKPIEDSKETQSRMSAYPTPNSDRSKAPSESRWSESFAMIVHNTTRRSKTPALHGVVSHSIAPDDVSDVLIHDSSYFRNTPNAQKNQPDVDLGKRKADYGQWKCFAEDSSDAELDSGRPSGRESSPDTHIVPCLPFLPQMNDTSDLLSHSLAPAPQQFRSGYGVNGSSHHARNFPSPSRVPELTRRSSNQSTNRPLEYSTDSAGADSPPVRPLSRRRPVRRGHFSRSPSNDRSGDESDSRNKVQKPTVPLPRLNAASRNLRRDRASGSAVTSHARRNRLNSLPQPPSAKRSASTPSERAESSSEVEVDHEHQRSSPTIGHTVVIPKADFARGRRLLAPANQDLPLSTILMRGDAQFIDQRRKTRISQYSLPVEDDTHHVEDACLLGDCTVVLGYDKGPFQVSLIPLEADQRPTRIDLTYKAHSRVIENRLTGKSYPNRGITCLAPVSSESFLSGGHDKKVYHWNIKRVDGPRADRKEHYSATSLRVPTEHTQPVQALAYTTWNDTLYSAAGDRIATTKLAALSHTKPERVSGKVTQVHVHPQDPRLVALEIDHMDYQVHFYDMREGGFARRPWLEFGYRAMPLKANRTGGYACATTSTSTSQTIGSPSFRKPGSRYARGSTANSLFARGYGDGVVLVWDYRNGAQKKVLERFRFQRPAEVTHTVLAGSDVIAYGGYSVTFWSMLAAKD